MKRLLALSFFTLLSSARLTAQQTASLSGTVLDPSGAAIVGAQITVENMAASPSPVSVRYDSAGRFV